LTGRIPAGRTKLQLFALTVTGNTTGAWKVDNVLLSRVSTPAELPLGPGLIPTVDGKAIQAAVSGALDIVDQVIVVKGKGITTALINDFAVAQNQLADAAVATSKDPGLVHC
jgi:hypothetical protein